MLPRFAKALGLALSMRATARDPDLRQGGLSFQRGYGFLKQKAPIFAGLFALLLFSFVFASWAKSRSLSAQNEVLAETLGKVTKSVLGEELTEPNEVLERLENPAGSAEKDPKPPLDAFDVMVAIAESVDSEIVHDVEELDLSRGLVKLHGIVSTTAEAETIVEKLKAHECFNGVKISKHNKVVNSDRQKYLLEFEVKCDDAKKKKAKDADKSKSADEPKDDTPGDEESE
jgi:general secretion pathway protein L